MSRNNRATVKHRRRTQRSKMLRNIHDADLRVYRHVLDSRPESVR